MLTGLQGCLFCHLTPREPSDMCFCLCIYVGCGSQNLYGEGPAVRCPCHMSRFLPPLRSSKPPQPPIPHTTKLCIYKSPRPCQHSLVKMSALRGPGCLLCMSGTAGEGLTHKGEYSGIHKTCAVNLGLRNGSCEMIGQDLRETDPRRTV